MTKKMQKLLKPAAIVAVISLLFAGCYPKGPEYYSDLDLTVTDYDTEYNFGDQKKYWIADTVRFITNIEDNDIEMINLRYAGWDGRLKALNFVISSREHLETILTAGE